MSNYQSQFDAQVTEANSAVANNTTALQGAFFEMHPAHVRRLLSNISKNLGKIDLGKVAHPEYLATNSENAAQRAVNLVSSIKSSFEGGPQGFITSVLPGLVEIDSQLSKAVGVDAYDIKTIKNLQIKAIDQALDRANVSQATIARKQNAVETTSQQVTEVSQTIKQLATDAEADRKRIADIRLAADKLSRGNSSQNPLEKLVRSARDRSDEIDQITLKARGSQTAAEASAAAAGKSSEAAAGVLERLQKTDQEASDILRNATQAGLAGAYKIERDRLAKEQNRFAAIFFAGILVIVAYAAFFILPLFSRILENGNTSTIKIGETTLLLIVRLVIIGPVVWALIFTNKRHSNLEILQMDYAAKSTTALAYSGYKQELDDDEQLGARLRDGLVVRFVEHPERLLRKNKVTESVGFGKDGITYSSTAVPKDASPVEAGEAEED